MKLLSSERELENPRTINQKIFRATTAVAPFSLFTGLTSMVKELLVARYFSRGDVLDAFLIAYLLPSFLVNLVASLFHSAVIPTFIQVRETDGREVAQRLFSGVMVWSLSLLLGVSILLAVLAPYFLPIIERASPERQAVA